MVDLSQLYSNTFLKIIKYKHSLPIDSSTPVENNISERKSKNKYDETEVRKICQNQKILSDDEIKQIIQGYGFEELGAVLSKDQAEKIAVEKLYISNELLVIFDALCNICEYTDALYKGMNTM